jgi:hypothetical protein
MSNALSDGKSNFLVIVKAVIFSSFLKWFESQKIVRLDQTEILNQWAFAGSGIRTDQLMGDQISESGFDGLNYGTTA